MTLKTKFSFASVAIYLGETLVYVFRVTSRMQETSFGEKERKNPKNRAVCIETFDPLGRSILRNYVTISQAYSILENAEIDRQEFIFCVKNQGWTDELPQRAVMKYLF